MAKLVMDVECYRNYFLVQFKEIEKGTVLSFEKYEGHPLDCARIAGLLKDHLIITFNGIDYDMPMLALAFKGATCAELKAASDQIIQGGLRSWQFESKYEVRVPVCNHIDLKEPVPGVMISLKLYGARLHSKRLQDLPIEHDAVITWGQRVELRTYCTNDLDTTIDLYNVATNPRDDIMATRAELGAIYGLELRSKSDAQIAEAVIKHEVTRLSGKPVYKVNVEPGKVYKYKAPAWLVFDSEILRATFAMVRHADYIVDINGSIVLPEVLVEPVKFGHSTYKLGIGGLHSTEKSKSHRASDATLLRDVDVVSYYPSLILACKLFPMNMGEHFQKVYSAFYHQRLAAKKTGNKSVAQTLKILLNGTFGKLGSKYSVLYSPDLLIQVTITGQLALLMLIERLERAGIPVVSANTDGVVSACPIALEPLRVAIVKQWEQDTGLETEETRYRGLFSRDVNNYLALKEDGKYKTKGVLTSPGVQKNPDNEIVAIAVCQQINAGIPIAQTILGCTDIRKFLRVKRVTGGAKFGDEYLGRVVRWYRRVGASGYIEYVKNGNKVAGSDGAQPMMTLEGFPKDIDYAYYLQEASDLLRDLGAMPQLAKINTSKAAANSFDTAALELAVLKIIADHPDGCTADEIKEAMPTCSWQSITPRFAPMLRKGLIVDTGLTKKGLSGRQQRIVRVAHHG